MLSYFSNNTSKTWVCLSTDEKEVNKPGKKKFENGSLLYEMDTTHIYMFDEDGNKWWPQLQSETTPGEV